MAAVALIVFLLWRLFRRCCMACCMRESCEQRRNAADPDTVLSGCMYWLHKSVVILVAVAALAMMLAGLIIAPKQLVVKIWDPLNHLSGYLGNTTDTMDGLIRELGTVNPILDNLTYIGNVDVNLTAIKANLQKIGVTLDLTAANPNTVTTALTALDSSVTSIRSQMAALRPQLQSGGLGGNVSTLSAGMRGLSTAVATFTNYATLLGALSVQLAALPTATIPSYSSTLLESAMASVEVTSWQAAVAAMLGSLDTWRNFRTSNSLGSLADSLSTLNTSLTSLQRTELPVAADAVKRFSNAWSAVTATLKSLLDRIDYIQANVAQLDTSSLKVVGQMRSVYSNLTAYQNMQPSPTSLASNLTALNSELNLGGASDLISSLNSVQTALNAVPASALDDARTAIANVKTALDNLQPKKDATDAAIATYKGSSTQANLDALKNTATVAGTTSDLTTAAKTSASAAAASSSVLAVQTAVVGGGLVAQVSSVQTSMASVDTSIGVVNASLSNRVPSLSTYISLTTSMKSVYDDMPTPKSQELAPVTSTVATVEQLMITVPRDVRVQVTSVNNSFGDGVHALRQKVIGNINKLEANYTDNVKMVDVARYRATCVILAVAATFTVLLIVFVIINCPWGIGCAIFFLLLLAICLFFLATAFAIVLVVAQDGCYHSERIVLTEVGTNNTVEPLLNYYFFANETVSVKAVLKSAKLVDVDQVTGQVVNLTKSITTNFTSVFTPRAKLQSVFNSITIFVNETLVDINVILSMAGVVNVRPLYVEVKSFPCCELTNYSVKAWVVMTFGGWLIFIACNLAMSYLGRLDQLPQSGCCGCKPLLKSRLKGKVHPEGDEDDGNKAVVLAPPGQQGMAGDGGVQPYGAYPPPPAVNPYTGAPVDPYTGQPMGPYQGAPPPYQGGPPPYQGGPPPYQGAPPPYQGAPPPYQGAPPPYQGAPPPY